MAMDEVGTADEMSTDTDTEVSRLGHPGKYVVGVIAVRSVSSMSTASWMTSSSVGSQSTVETSAVAEIVAGDAGMDADEAGATTGDNGVDFMLVPAPRQFVEQVVGITEWRCVLCVAVAAAGSGSKQQHMETPPPVVMDVVGVAELPTR